MSNERKKYSKIIADALMSEFKYSSVMEIPKLEKIVLNYGVGDATIDAKNLELACNELEAITGQKPVKTKAKKAIATYKLRQGQEIGAKVTLRGPIMWNFVEKLVHVAIPRIRDFKGLNKNSFDGQGNYTMGIKEQIIFTEIVYDNVKKVRGFDVTFVTSAKTDAEAKALLSVIGLPFKRN